MIVDALCDWDAGKRQALTRVTVALGDGLAQFRAKQPPATAIGPSGAFYFSALDARLRRKGRLNLYAQIAQVSAPVSWTVFELQQEICD